MKAPISAQNQGYLPQSQDVKAEAVVNVPVGQLHPFQDHPFHVTDDEELQELARSIAQFGVLTPLLARPAGDGYEIISGHRRHAAAVIAEVQELPVIVRELNDDDAIILMVDSNQQREHVLPSEKAFAYKMKLAAMKHQGKRTDLTSCQIGTKLRTDEALAEDVRESARTIQRYIRLTYLDPRLLQMVDYGQIALSPAVELSYLKKEAQGWLLDAIEMTQATPSYSQAFRMHAKVKDGTLDIQDIYSILREEKANQKERISFRSDTFSRFFPSDFTVAEMEAYILKLLKKDQQELQKMLEVK